MGFAIQLMEIGAVQENEVTRDEEGSLEGGKEGSKRTRSK